MRIQPGASVEETIEALAPAQRRLIQRAENARAREQRIIQESMDKSRIAVQKALDGGVPARVMAARLGVSLARVYQMRDEAREVLEESA